MNIIDIILIVPVAWFAYMGFRKGLIIELTSLAALILGIYAAIHFRGYIATFLSNNFNFNEEYVPIIAFVITFVIVVILVFILGKIIEKFINLIALGFLNKLAGTVFGIAKGVVLLSIVLLIINKFDEDFISESKKENSLLYRPILSVAPFLWNNIKDLNIEDPLKKESEVEEDQNLVDASQIKGI